jgi:hypothetical protein
MSVANPQTQAIQIANTLFNLSSQLMSVYTQMVVLDQQWTDQGSANVINALGTVAINVDGSTGAADATPNVAHPVDPAKYPQVQRSLSANQIASIKTVLDNIVTYVNGSAVAATPSARGILNSAVGG